MGSAGSTRVARRRVTVLGIVGESLVTLGVLVLLFVGWQNLWDTWVLNAQQTSAAGSLGRQWLGDPARTTRSGSSGDSSGATTVVPVDTEPAPTQPVGVIYVPRFGKGWKRIIRETVRLHSVLDSWNAGVGHYPGTAMPGGLGNFAVAAHDTGYGNTFLHLQNLHLGDAIYIQTRKGFYTYRFRDYEYVQPDAVSVLLPVPRRRTVEPTDRIITMTTCNPPYHGRERIIAYGVFQSFSRTPPKAIAGEVG